MKTIIQNQTQQQGQIDTEAISRLLIQFTKEAGLLANNEQDILQAFRHTIQQGINQMVQTRTSVTFRHAAKESLKARQYRRPSTRADLQSFIQRMLRNSEFSKRLLRDISVSECRCMLNDIFGHSAHSYRKAKTILHSVFSYGIKQGWCSVNPAKSIESPPVVEERIEILKTRQINALVRTCECPEFSCMAPAVYLMLWCGIRPGEVRRLRWRDIDPKEQVVYIEGIHSKTGGARAIPLRGEALKLCTRRGAESEYIAPRNWIRLWKRCRTRAGIRKWQPDVLRHTFASLHLKYFHNLIQLQEEMGHRDCTLLRTRYLNLRNISSTSASKFFRR